MELTMNIKIILFVGIFFASSISNAMKRPNIDQEEKKSSQSNVDYTPWSRPEIEPVPRPAKNVKIYYLPLKYDEKRDMHYYGRSLDEIPLSEFSNREPIQDDEHGTSWSSDPTGPAKRYITKKDWCYQLDPIMDGIGISGFESRQAIYRKFAAIPKDQREPAFGALRSIPSGVDEKDSIELMKDCILHFVPSGPQQDADK